MSPSSLSVLGSTYPCPDVCACPPLEQGPRGCVKPVLQDQLLPQSVTHWAGEDTVPGPGIQTASKRKINVQCQQPTAPAWPEENKL